MCKLLVRVEDKINPNCPYLNAKCTKQGDVITMVEDDHVWSTRELSSPEWIIIEVPGVPISDLEALLVPEPLVHKLDDVAIKQRRAFRLNIGNLEQLLGYKLNVPNTPIIKLTYDGVMSLRTKVPRLMDPNKLEDTIPGVL